MGQLAWPLGPWAQNKMEAKHVSMSPDWLVLWKKEAPLCRRLSANPISLSTITQSAAADTCSAEWVQVQGRRGPRVWSAPLAAPAPAGRGLIHRALIVNLRGAISASQWSGEMEAEGSSRVSLLLPFRGYFGFVAAHQIAAPRHRCASCRVFEDAGGYGDGDGDAAPVDAESMGGAPCAPRAPASV